MFNKKNRKDDNNGEKRTALADRVGTYTPDMTDRRRIAVSEVMMHVAMNGGMLVPQMLAQPVMHNIVSVEELMPFTEDVMKRIMKIAQGGEY